MLTIIFTGMECALAQDVAATQSLLTLPEAVEKALASNPSIRATSVAVDIQRARRDNAALGTQYVLSANVEDAFGSGQFDGLDSAESTLRVTKNIEMGNKRQFREELGDAQVAQAELDVRQQRIDIAGEVARRYADVLRAQQRLVLAGEALALNARTLNSVQRRFDVGRASEAELALTRVALARTELTVQRRELELDAAKARLAALWGEERPGFDQVAGDLYQVPIPQAFEAFEARLGDNISLRRIDSEIAVIEANQRLADAAGSPNLLVSGGLRRLGQTDDTAMVFSLGVPLGSASRAATRRREADSRSEQIPYLRRSRELELRTQLYVSYTSLEADRAQLEGLRKTVLPEAETAVKYFRRGYEAGSSPLLDLLAAQRQLLDIRIEALDTATAVHKNLIDIETLLGNDRPGEAFL